MLLEGGGGEVAEMVGLEVFMVIAVLVEVEDTTLVVGTTRVASRRWCRLWHQLEASFGKGGGLGGGIGHAIGGGFGKG